MCNVLNNGNIRQIVVNAFFSDDRKMFPSQEKQKMGFNYYRRDRGNMCTCMCVCVLANERKRMKDTTKVEESGGNRKERVVPDACKHSMISFLVNV